MSKCIVLKVRSKILDQSLVSFDKATRAPSSRLSCLVVLNSLMVLLFRRPRLLVCCVRVVMLFLPDLVAGVPSVFAVPDNPPITFVSWSGKIA
jgi:hypothetical protein